MTLSLAPRSSRRIARIAAILLLAAGAARAQDVVRFDPSRDLEGFEACFASEFREIYPLETYSDMLAKEMTPAALAEVRARWKADLEEGQAKLAALRADPAEESVWLLRHRLAKSAYFSKIALVEDRTVPGFLVLLQKSAKGFRDRTAGPAAKYGPSLEKLAHAFEDQYAKPLALQQSRARTLWAVAILADEGEYREFWRVHPNFVSTAASACYDWRLGLAVGIDDAAKPGDPETEQRYPILNAVARGMIDGYSSTPEGRPGSLWIEEGLASYLASRQVASPASKDDRHPPSATLRTIVDLAQDRKKGPVLLHPLEELVALKSSEDIDESMSRVAGALGAKFPPGADVSSAYYGESALWMQFLHQGMDGKLREPLMRYLRTAFAGDAGTNALRAAFERRDLPEIDRAYLKWIAEEARRVMPPSNVQEATIRAVLDPRSRMAPKDAAPDAAKPLGGGVK